ncbi:MAG: polyamine aminopropyltransferase [Thiotrichaceae bacterium]
MNLDKNWFSEINPQFGVAFSLQIKEKLHEEQTQYQKISIYDTTDFGKLMTIDDLFMVTDRDNFLYHEMMSHPTLFTHLNPRHIVIIGGGDCGTLREVLKHPTVERATQVEIDERVTRLAEQYFPNLCESNQDPRANLLFEDGIKWMADAPDQSIDVIIIDSTDPVGPAEGLFNLAFYQQCRRVLREDGILVQQTESPLLHLPLLQSVHRAMREANFKNARTFQFPQCIYPSGWWTGTMAGNTDLAQFRIEAAKNKTFTTHYYNPEIHQASFALPNFMSDALR